jgi:hypothetical protein
VGKSDPYAVVYMGRAGLLPNDMIWTKIGQTKVIDNELNPVWEEEFPLRVNVEIVNTLKVEVWDYDKVGQHEFLGQVELEGPATDALPIYDTRYELLPRYDKESVGWKEALFNYDVHVGGKITLAMINNASEEVRKWGINGAGRLVPLPKDYHAEPEPELETYTVVISTGGDADAGTRANIFVRLVGKRVGKRTGELPCNGDTSTHRRMRRFGKGATDEFAFEEESVGEMLKLRVGHDDSGMGGSGWFCDKVSVNIKSTGQTVVFGCGKWFDKKKGDGKIVRDLVPTEFFEKRGLDGKTATERDALAEAEAEPEAEPEPALSPKAQKKADKKVMTSSSRHPIIPSFSYHLIIAPSGGGGGQEGGGGGEAGGGRGGEGGEEGGRGAGGGCRPGSGHAAIRGLYVSLHCHCLALRDPPYKREC